MIVNASTWKKWGLLLVIVLALMVFPVGAFTTTTINATNVGQYSVSASPGHYIFEIIIDSLPVGTNQTHVLNFKGYTYLLEIDTVHSYGVYNDFWVTLTYPNGTVETVESGQTSVFQTYKTKIQPVYMQQEGFTLLQIALAVGTNPTKVTFSDLEFASYDVTTAIPFTSVSGQFSGEKSTVYAYECTEYDFQNDISKGNLLPNLNVLSGFFEWTWAGILAFVSMIPFVGSMLVPILEFIGTIGGTLIFWLSYIILNSPLIIAGGELLLIVFAFLLCGKRPTPERFVKTWVNYNVRSVMGFIWAVDTLRVLVLHPIDTITNIVNGLKPI